MKRFLYGRLYDLHLGYAFHIPFGRDAGPLTDAIAKAPVDAEHRVLFLQSRQGQISFGVKEELVLRDYGNRLRDNFMGYRLEDGEGPNDLPFFDSLSSQFAAITREAQECHARLDEDSHCGANMREMQIRFDRGHFLKTNAWDSAVMKIANDPNQDLLMLFDDHGNELPLYFRLRESEVIRGPRLLGIVSTGSFASPMQARGTAPPEFADAECAQPTARIGESLDRVQDYTLGIVSSVGQEDSGGGSDSPEVEASQRVKPGCMEALSKWMVKVLK